MSPCVVMYLGIELERDIDDSVQLLERGVEWPAGYDQNQVAVHVAGVY